LVGVVKVSVSLPPLTALPDIFMPERLVIGCLGTATAALFFQQSPENEFQPLGQLLP